MKNFVNQVKQTISWMLYMNLFNYMKCQFCSGTINFSKLVLCDSVQLLYCIYLQECLLIVNKSVLLLLIMVYIMYSKLIQTMFTFPVTSVSSSKKYFIWTLCFGWDFIRVHRMTSGDIVCGAQRHKFYVTNN